ncbi:hypothetical protein LX32DRAFT_685261 [Colletotrichum zoysiae]|uniref:Uncharacterized protein n=1 Tax=Colletotrichum zoysiae TaxID=1216348 RepID=A0AAD9HCD1_9PEZI|nr:hypothetical protein LX32DRAFT_685261 [Colletotrichum zoysiae]
MVHPDVFFISGVSLPIPPWPENPILSGAVLLHPANVKRFGQSLECNNVQDRQRRIYVNLVVLFRLITHCRHLAFDHDAFWTFIQRHWGITNACSQKIEHLVDIYSERRRVYLAAPYIRRKHCDLLTDLIDAWNSRDSSPEPSFHLSRRDIADEWDRVKTSWLEQLRLDHHSLLDESNPPTIGAFPAKNTPSPSGLQIKGGSSRAPPSGKSLFDRVTDPSPARHRMSPATPNRHTTESPAPKPAEDAIVDLIQAESRKRRFASDAPDTAKRQCIPASPLRCPPPENEAASAARKPAAKGQLRNGSGDMSIDASLGPAQDASQHGMGAQQAEQSLTLGDPAASCIEQHVGVNNSLSSVAFDRRMQESDKEVEKLKEQTRLLLESRELSRDIQKAHDHLIMFTASKCQEALEKLDQLSNQVNVLGTEAAAFRQSGEQLQKRQTEQQDLIQGFQGHIAGVQSALEEARKEITASGSRRSHDDKYIQAVEARLSQLESKLESQTEPSTLEKDETGSLEAVAPMRFNKLHEETEIIDPSHPLKVEFANRFKKMEGTIATSTALINNCRTLVEVSKTTVDQHLQALDSRVKLLENQLSNHIALQAKIGNEQTKRLELVEAELTRYKEAASNQLQQERPSRSEFADLQAQLNAMKKSVAIIEQRQGANLTDENLGTPLSPISQTALNRTPRSEQKLPSSRKHVPNTVAVKNEN